MNGASSQYLKMYKDSLAPIVKNLLFQPMTRHNEDILFSGTFHMRDEKGELEPMVQHLGCFAGGMLALGAKLMKSDDDLILARKLTDGCIWAYNSTKAGAMPEVFHIVACVKSDCDWNEDSWYSAVAKHLGPAEGDKRSTHERVKSKIHDDRLVESYTKIDASKYILR